MSEALLLTGKRGMGKSLLAVHMMRDAVTAGRMVATNLNIKVEHLVSARSKVCPYRVPDHPRAADLEQLPLGNPALKWTVDQAGNRTGEVEMQPGFDEGKNGLLVLDEVATFLNSRSWQEKDRQAVISWLAQSRKFGWDLLFLAQHPRMVDAQIRESLFELVGYCRRLDKVRIPFFGAIANAAGVKLRMPRLHLATIRNGSAPDGPIAERYWYRGTDLYAAYQTTQKIDPVVGVSTGSGFQYLSAWHVRGRHLSWWEMNRLLVALLIAGGAVAGACGLKLYQSLQPASTPLAAVKPAEDKFADGVTARGYFKEPAGGYRVVLSDGRIVFASSYRETPSGWQVRVGELWYRGEK